MKKMRLAIIGLGNLGRKCAEAVDADQPLLLAGVVRRSGSPAAGLKAPVVTHISQLNDVDAALVCVPPDAVEGVAVVGAGCDPGALSLFRSYFALLAPWADGSQPAYRVKPAPYAGSGGYQGGHPLATCVKRVSNPMAAFAASFKSSSIPIAVTEPHPFLQRMADAPSPISGLAGARRNAYEAAPRIKGLLLLQHLITRACQFMCQRFGRHRLPPNALYLN